MTPLTRCELRCRSTVLLRPMVVFGVMVLLAVAASLALAQIHLRFMIRDMQIETRQLQRVRAESINRKNALVTEVEQLARYEHLRQYAETELGLRECPPERSERTMVSSAALARWDDAEELMARVHERCAPEGDNLLAVVGERMISWSSVALARGELADELDSVSRRVP